MNKIRKRDSLEAICLCKQRCKYCIEINQQLYENSNLFNQMLVHLLDVGIHFDLLILPSS